MSLSFDSVWRRLRKNGDRALEVHPAENLTAPPPPSAEELWQAHLDKAGIPRHLHYPSTTLGRILDQSADRFGDTEAILYNHHRWTYREFLADVNRMAGGLAHLGVRRGERVLLVLPNCPEFAIAFMAIQKLGAVVVNAGPLMGHDDLQTVISMTNPRVAIGLDLQAGMLHSAARGSAIEHLIHVSLQAYQPVLKWLGYQIKLWQNRDTDAAGVKHMLYSELMKRAPARPPTVQSDPSAVAVLQATGGTTGTLKLAQLTHRNLLANAMQVSVWESAKQGQERIFAVLPMFHVYGLTLCLITSIFTAGTIIMMTRFDAEQMLELIRKHKPTICPIVPAICDAISDLLEQENGATERDDTLNGLRLCISGAAPLTAQTAERFKRLTGATVIEGYGLTEAAPVTHAGLPSDVRIGAIGLPMPDTRVRVADLADRSRDVAAGEAGELLINGPQVMAGYFANPEQTAKVFYKDDAGDTWLCTGDVGRMDEEGFFHLLDRKKEMIIRSGLKIFPNKVERVLRTHKQVRDVAVVGRLDSHQNERVVAVIAPAPPEEERAKLADELRTLCRQHLAPYEVPQEFEFMEQLPRSALGKLLKRELRKGKVSAVDPVLLPDPEGAIPRKAAADVEEDLSDLPGDVDAKVADNAIAPPQRKIAPQKLPNRLKDLDLPQSKGPSGNGRSSNSSGNGNGRTHRVSEQEFEI